MTTTIVSQVNPDDLAYEIDLAKRFTDQVGFLSVEALAHYAAIGGVYRARENDEPAGFLVFTPSVKTTPRLAQIFQAAVQMDAQRRHHGLALVAQAELDARTARAWAIQCWCAADLESNEFWRAAGFTHCSTRLGGSRRGRRHFLWRKAILLRLDAIPPHSVSQDALGRVRLPLDDLWDRPILDAIERKSQ